MLSGDLERNDLADPNGVVTTTANITGTNAYHVVTGEGVTETAMLDGFVVTYDVTSDDPDLPLGDALTIDAPTLPSWLTLTDHGDGTATLSGIPTDADVGDHPVLLRVTDSGGLTATQAFTITVFRAFNYVIYLPLVVRNTP